jgi:branched-chain amino acid transport system ATP-binding protein
MLALARSILLVEQFARTALPIADAAAVVLQGVIAHQGSPDEMEEALSASYLGG